MKFEIETVFKDMKKYVLNNELFYSHILYTRFSIITLHECLIFIYNLPFGKNKIRGSLLSLINEMKGNCSSKNGLFYAICNENKFNFVNLNIGAFKIKSRIKILVYLKINEFIFDLSRINIFEINDLELLMYEEINLSNLNLVYKNEFIENVKINYLNYEII